MDYPLNSDDLNVLLPGVPIFTYPELRGKRLEDILSTCGKVVILFLTTGISMGHWICVFRRGADELHFFDSYGLRPDGERKWLSHDKLVQLNEADPIVSNLFKEAHNRGLDCWYSETAFQNARDESETCGRHVAVRLWNTDLDEEGYKDFIRRQQAATRTTADQLVVNLTKPILGK